MGLGEGGRASATFKNGSKDQEAEDERKTAEAIEENFESERKKAEATEEVFESERVDNTPEKVNDRKTVAGGIPEQTTPEVRGEGSQRHNDDVLLEETPINGIGNCYLQPPASLVTGARIQKNSNNFASESNLESDHKLENINNLESNNILVSNNDPQVGSFQMEARLGPTNKMGHEARPNMYGDLKSYGSDSALGKTVHTIDGSPLERIFNEVQEGYVDSGVDVLTQRRRNHKAGTKCTVKKINGNHRLEEF
ncbi:hypothetical protein L6452_20553 [Arctium lappa]|uniref:Uncharacterized protein n=1 Tax=Arctium lappa TaxID=4217 RepID=A0ACB9BD08_ARCLA|nr:hypothetical protein L6452_20553 [Arctium lappa]